MVQNLEKAAFSTNKQNARANPYNDQAMRATATRDFYTDKMQARHGSAAGSE